MQEMILFQVLMKSQLTETERGLVFEIFFGSTAIRFFKTSREVTWLFESA